MGPPSGPRAANVAEARDRILKAAIAEFAQNGFTGTTIENICVAADISSRMVYHYYTDKVGLYLGVLEHVLGELRLEELNLDISTVEPLDGLLSMFNFTFNHFASHPQLIRLLSAENLMEARFLKASEATPVTASPVLRHIDALLQRGEALGSVRSGIDPLHLYIMMVALSYFHKSNGFTLAVIFDAPVMSADWQAEHYKMARSVLAAYLRPAEE